MDKFPVRVNLIPDQLSALVHYHPVTLLEEPFFCWTYVTTGLSQFGQKELVATIQCEPHEKPEDFSLDVLAFFKTVYELAGQGQLVDVGDYSQFGSLFFERFLGVLYLAPEQSVFAEIELPSSSCSYLALLFITEEEIELYKTAGLMRILTRLGKANCFYPYPTWTQKKRNSVVAANENSVLGKIPGVAIRYTSVIFNPQIHEIRLYLSPSLKQDWNNVLQQIPANTPVFLIAEFIPRANGALVWNPGQTQLEAISPPKSAGSAICGCFIILCPGQEQDSAKIVEDGFALMLQDSSWEKLKKAITTQSNISMATKGELKQFKLEWLNESYYNPIDEKNYVAPGGWVSYGQTKRENVSSKVKLQKIILLTEEAILKNNISSEALAPFIKEMDKQICDVFSSSEVHFELLLQITLHMKKAAEFEIAHRGGKVTEEEISQLHEKLTSLDSPNTVNDLVQFQAHFVVKG